MVCSEGDRDRDLVVRGACGVDVVSRLEREVSFGTDRVLAEGWVEFQSGLAIS